MRAHKCQSGISLTGFIVFLLVFVVIAFSAGWFANTYYANRLFLESGLAPDFPSVIKVDAKPDGLTWDGQNLIFTNRSSPWGLVRITPLENGQYRKTSIPVVDEVFQQQISFRGISWNGTSLITLASGDWFQSVHKKVFVELDPLTFKISRVIGPAPDFAHCMAWDGQNYWAGTRFNTEDQPGKPTLYKFNEKLKLLDEFDGAGKGCQGMVWDGKFLWWGDVFDDAVTLYDIYHSTSVPPAIVHQYKPTIKQQSGIAFDGKDIWFGDYRNLQLNRLHEDLYFDWLGGHYEIKHPGHLSMLQRFGKYQSGEIRLDDLIKPLLQGKIKAVDIPAYVDTLRSRYSADEIRQILNTARAKVSQKSLATALGRELNNLVESGNIDYSDDEPIEADSVKIKYFRAAIDNGNLVADWKVVVGSDILSGIDAPRPQQIPDDYDFYTFVQYTINIKNLAMDTEEELDYDVFENEDEQTDVILLQNIKPGDYKIDIEIRAQYYTETTASHYNGKLEIKLSY